MDEQVIFYNLYKMESEAELFNGFPSSLIFLDLVGFFFPHVT